MGPPPRDRSSPASPRALGGASFRLPVPWLSPYFVLHAYSNLDFGADWSARGRHGVRLGVDVGGTFTDLLLHDERTRRTYEAKTPSTPEDQSIGVAAGVKLVCEKAGIDPAELALIRQGTTVATNAVLEGRGARVGLLVTEGFEYTLHLAKSWTPGPLFGWIVMDKPDPLASLADTRGIPERMDARGAIVRPLDIAKATALID